MHARFVTVLLCGILAASLLPAEAQHGGGQMGDLPDAATYQLAQAHHTQRFPEVFQPGENLPDFANGYLISWTSYSSAKDATNVVLWGRDGMVERSARIWLDDAKRMYVAHAAATDAGNVVVAGHAELRTSDVLYFVAKTDLNGEITEVVRTNPFVPMLVCMAPDGSAWSLGRDLGKDQAREDYGLLRQYSFRAGQVRELLQRRSFGPGESPVRGRLSAFLRCTKDRVDAYVNSTHEYFEILESGNTVRRFRVEPPQFGTRRIEALAVLSDGSAFSTIRGRGDQPRRVYELQCDDEKLTASWVPVPGAGHPPEEGFVRPPYGMLFGAEGNSLVLSSKNGLAWVEAQIRQQ